jgi:hypothetical protein
MSTPRNAPCPCGSGLKFKKCCGGVTANAVALDPEVAYANGIKRADMELHDVLMRYLRKRLGDKWLHGALDLFMEEALEGMEQAEIELAIPWVLFHCPVTETGESIARVMLEEPRLRIAETQLAVLVAQLRTWLSIWEVTAIDPGVGISLTDLLTGATTYVYEIKASQTVSLHTSILARVVMVHDVAFIAGVHPHPLTPRFTDRAVTSMRKYFRLRTRPVKSEKLRDPTVQLDLVNVWRLLVELQMTPPEVTNTDGDPLAFITDRFDFPSARRAAVITALGALPGAGPVLQDDEGTEIVITRPRATGSTPGSASSMPFQDSVIGRIEVLKTHLLVETNSIARADKLKAAISSALGTLVRFRIREEADVQELMEDARQAQQSGLVPPPPESSPEMDEMMREFREQYMQTWLDDNIPALGGLTPRQAAADPKQHAALKSLLHELDYHESRLPAAQRTDLSKLREQLGM